MAIAITVLYGGTLVAQGALKVGVLVAFTYVGQDTPRIHAGEA
jgi:hypothetical protein